MLFSRRRGLIPAVKPLQLETIDDELRNALWSVFHELFEKTFRPTESGYGAAFSLLAGSNREQFFTVLWLSYFKVPTDTVPESFDRAVAAVRKHFFEAPWYRVYDFMPRT